MKKKLNLEDIAKLMNSIIDNKVVKRLDNIEGRLINVENRLTNVEGRLINVENHTKNDDTIIEKEMNEIINNHINEQFKGYYIKNLSDEFKSIKNPQTKDELIEFDGLFKLEPKNNIKDKNILVIVEAKKTVDMDKIIKKIYQRNLLLKIINIAKNEKISDIEILKYLNINFEKNKINSKNINSFRKTLKIEKFNTINEVYLYIGSYLWDSKSIKFLNELKNKSLLPKKEIKSITYNNVLTLQESPTKKYKLKKDDGFTEENGFTEEDRKNSNLEKYFGYIKFSGNRFKVEDNFTFT